MKKAVAGLLLLLLLATIFASCQRSRYGSSYYKKKKYKGCSCEAIINPTQVFASDIALLQISS